MQQQRSQQREWTSINTSKQKQKEEVIVTKKKADLPPPVYYAFPHRHSPLVDDVIPWTEAGAYFVMYADNRCSTRRIMHRDCQGILSVSMKAEAYKYVEKHPVIVMDLSVCPMLLQEYEWPFSILKQDEAYRNCTCSFAKYMLEEEDIERHHFKLEAPYFYLCNMNLPDRRDLREVLLPRELLLRDDQMRRNVVQ